MTEQDNRAPARVLAAAMLAIAADYKEASWASGDVAIDPGVCVLVWDERVEGDVDVRTRSVRDRASLVPTLHALADGAPILAAGFVAEAYTSIGRLHADGTVEGAPGGPGALAQRFAEGDVANVREALVATVVDRVRDEQLVMAVMFTVADDGTLEWDAMPVSDEVAVLDEGVVAALRGVR